MMKQRKRTSPGRLPGREVQRYLPLFSCEITTSQFYHLTSDHMVGYNNRSSNPPGDKELEEKEHKAMKLKNVNLQVASQGPKYELTWLKAKELAESGETFCIDKISRGKNPDDHGNFFWFLRLKKDGLDFDTERWMVKIQVGNETRDNQFVSLQKEMLDDHSKGGDGILHGVKLVQLAAQKGRNGFIILEALTTGTCPCGETNLDENEPGDYDDLGDLNDHPF